MVPRSSFSSAVADIQALLGDADPATAELDDATRAWLLDTRQAITAQRRGRGRRRARALVPHRARGQRRRMLAVAGALAVAAGLAGGLLAAPLAGRGPASGHAKLSLTAARFLDRAAAAAARQPALQVRDGQYMYIASEVRWGSTTVTPGGRERTVVEPRHKREIWLPASNICKPGLLKDPSPGRAMKLNGARGLPCPNQGGWGDPSYRFLQSLPAGPHTLLTMLHAATNGAGQGGRDWQAFTAIGDSLQEAIAPPDVSAALYRAAALIPGVRVIPHATDILGRPGIGVQLTRTVPQSPGAPLRQTLTWIFNPTTLLWIGETDGTVHGKLMGSVVLNRAIVDQLGQRP